MGALHNELRRGAFSKAVKAAVGDSKGPGGLERYSETLQPVLNLWDRADFSFLRDELLFAQLLAQGGVVAEFSSIAISNASAKSLVIVTDVFFGATAANDCNLYLLLRTSLATLTEQANGPIARDTRAASKLIPASPVQFLSPRLHLGSDPALFSAAGNTIIERNIPTAGLVLGKMFSPPYVLAPGMALLVENAVVNQSLRALFIGYVRAALPGELE